MSIWHSRGGDVFEMHCDLIDVTSLHRPDTGWRLIDAQGHEHRWYVDGKPATSYSPSEKHEAPTLSWIFEGWGYWEDGERYAIGHHECSQCGEHVEPRYCPDSTTQHIAGLRNYRVNGEHVSEDEFKRRVEIATHQG